MPHGSHTVGQLRVGLCALVGRLQGPLRWPGLENAPVLGLCVSNQMPMDAIPRKGENTPHTVEGSLHAVSASGLGVLEAGPVCSEE